VLLVTAIIAAAEAAAAATAATAITTAGQLLVSWSPAAPAVLLSLTIIMTILQHQFQNTYEDFQYYKQVEKVCPKSSYKIHK
jgi:fatty acid desaturase